MIKWENTLAAIYRSKKDTLKPVFEIDPISLDELLNIDEQKEKIIQNTKDFLDKKTASHVLLWGSRGAGKSSLVKALLNKYHTNGLRIIEVSKDDLSAISEIIDTIRDEPYFFIFFCDDLSFEDGDVSYKGLKSVIDGSIELPPKNVLIYATSNKRHLLSEYHKDNDGSYVKDGVIHYSDLVEEKISLSERFGIWLSFYQGTYDDYLKIVDSHFPNISIEKRLSLHEEAKIFASLRASRSGRCAKQFSIIYAKDFA